MPSLTSSYVLPAIILNPAFILHLINTFVSRFVSHPPIISQSPHPFIESVGPVPGSKLYLDMHADDQLCWRYTFVMVVVQILAFGSVSDRRGRRKARKAATLEKERSRKEQSRGEELKNTKFAIQEECDGYTTDDTFTKSPQFEILKIASGYQNCAASDLSRGDESRTENEESMTETSNEDTMI